MDKIISALFLPAVTMILFTRITYSRTISFLLTFALIIVSAIKGYIYGWVLISIEAASLTAGLFVVNYLKKRKAAKQHEDDASL